MGREGEGSSRVPRRLVELGIAATASVGLAACYGAPPPRYYDVEAPTPREQHAFRLAGEPGGRARATANARIQGCEVSSGAVLVASCGKVKLRIEEAESGALDVICRGAPELDCKALLDMLLAK